jgi:hypothetical protein
MTLIEKVVIIKLLHVNVYEKNIFDVLDGVHRDMRTQKQDLQNEEFNFNDKDVRFKFSVVYTDFRVNHPKLYENIDRSTSKLDYFYMFNKFDENEDSYY